MTEIRHVVLKETLVGGQGFSTTLIKTGEKFCWLRLELHHSKEAASAALRMIEEFGIGPFVLEEIREIPAGHILFKFNDQNGKERQVSKTYFTVF
jgi:hypothetical protein